MTPSQLVTVYMGFQVKMVKSPCLSITPWKCFASRFPFLLPSSVLLSLGRIWIQYWMFCMQHAKWHCFCVVVYPVYTVCSHHSLWLSSLFDGKSSNKGPLQCKSVSEAFEMTFTNIYSQIYIYIYVINCWQQEQMWRIACTMAQFHQPIRDDWKCEKRKELCILRIPMSKLKNVILAFTYAKMLYAFVCEMTCGNVWQGERAEGWQMGNVKINMARIARESKG